MQARSVGVITGACAVGCTRAGQFCGSRSVARVRCIFPHTRAYTHLMVSVTTSRVERSYTHIVSTLHSGRCVIRLSVEGDGRSLVGRLHPPLKGGWPLRTPPLINIPSLSAKPLNGSGLINRIHAKGLGLTEEGGTRG